MIMSDFNKDTISTYYCLRFLKGSQPSEICNGSGYTVSDMSFHGGSAGKESAWNVGDLGLIPGLGRSPGERKGYPLQYCGLENCMDCIIHGIIKSQTRLSDFHFTSLRSYILNSES